MAEPCSRWLRGLLLHAAPRLPSLRHFLLALPSLGRQCRRPRLRGLPQSAEPVRPCLPQQLLQCGLPPHAGRQWPPRLWDQAGVWEALVQHRRAAHEGQGAHGQHLVGHVISVPVRVWKVWIMYGKIIFRICSFYKVWQLPKESEIIFKNKLFVTHSTNLTFLVIYRLDVTYLFLWWKLWSDVDNLTTMLPCYLDLHRILPWANSIYWFKEIGFG